jgi:hypothetical protein
MNGQIADVNERLATVLPHTPAGVLTTLPGIGVVRASDYGAALGDPACFVNADQAYRASGLVPASYESAGPTRRGQGISREGNAELRSAIIELGRGLAQRDAEFARYRASVANRMKPLQAAIAGGHRAHRLAFALMRSGEPYDPERLLRAVTTGGERRTKKTGGPVRKINREAVCRHDVTHPAGVHRPAHNHNRQDLGRHLTRVVAGARTDVAHAKRPVPTTPTPRGLTASLARRRAPPTSRVRPLPEPPRELE